ncbi:MAG TPA: hypothetical protein ENI89_00055 [Desulfobulbus sp.]|nr:hypothetical protein [Desulfobulbus sp.]
MADSTFQVVFLGNLRPGTVPEEAADRISSLFRIDRERADKLVNSRKQVVVRRGASRRQAMAIRQRLEELGLLTRMVEEGAGSPPQATAANRPDRDPPPSRSATGEENPYAAPAAELEEAGAAGHRRAEPARVPAGHGWRWMADAFTMFKEQPWSWLGAILLMYLLIMPVNLIPAVGWIVAYLVGPVFSGGLMIGAHAQAEGGRFRIAHLFSGFSQNRNRLLGLGALICLGGIAGMLVMFVLTGGMSGFAGPRGLNFSDPATMAAISANGGMLLFILVGLVLGTLFIMATWFASVLVAVDGESPLTALRLSFKATWKNGLAFLVSGLAFILVWMGISVLMGIMVFVLVKLAPHLSRLWSLLPIAVMGILGLASMGLATVLVYTSYRDIFRS